MKFRKFFKKNDFCTLLKEDRHYMKHSAIPSDTFPAPLPVLNILNAVGSEHLQIKVFGWIFTEGIKNAAVARKDFAKKWSKQLGVNIPQEAIFSTKAMEQIPQLAENIEAIEEEWMLQFEPKQINIPITSNNVQNMNVIPLGEINSILVRQGKMPLYFGGRDGLLEYIENGHWRSEQIGSSKITPFDKKGISLTVDEGSDGTKIMPNGERVISLGESPEKSQGKPLTFDDMEEKYGLQFWDGDFSSSKQAEVKITGDRKLSITMPGSDPEIFSINFKGNVESSLFVPAGNSEFFGSYVAPPFFNNIPYWSKKLEISKSKGARVVKRVIDDVIKSGKSFSELNDNDLSEEEFDYLRQLIDNGEISPESFESRKMTMKELAGIMTRGLKGDKQSTLQKASGTGENGGPTDEEWIKYKAAVKAGLVARLTAEPSSPSEAGNAWGGDRWRPRIAVSDERGVVDLTDYKWKNLSVSQNAEAIANQLIPMIFDDESKAVATQLNISWPAQSHPQNAEVNATDKKRRKKATKPIAQFFGDTKSIENYPGQTIEVPNQGAMQPISTQDVATSIASMGGDILKMPGVEFKTVVPVSRTEIDSSKFRDWIPFFNLESPDPNNKGKTIKKTVRADSIDDIPRNVTMAVLQHAGNKKQIVRLGPDLPWEEVRPKNDTSSSEDEIQSYIQNSGYKPAWLDKRTLQLTNPESGDELLFHARLQNGERKYFNIPPVKNTTVENPYVHGLNVTVNTQDYHRIRIAGSSEEQKQDFEYYRTHPEEFGNESSWNKYPPEVIVASKQMYVTEQDPNSKPEQILDKFGTAATFYLSNQIHNLRFRYGELDQLPNKLSKKGISDHESYKQIQKFVEKWLFQKQKYAKEMKDTNSLSEVVKLSDGTPVCGIDQNGDAVFATPVYEALLSNGWSWRMSKAASGMRKAMQDDIASGGSFSRGVGSSGSDDEYDPFADAEDDSVGWADSSDDDEYDPSEFYGDDELEDEIGVKRGKDFDSEDLSGYSIAGVDYNDEPQPDYVDDDWAKAQLKRRDLRGARSGEKTQDTQIQSNVPTNIVGFQPNLGSMSGMKSFKPEQPKPKSKPKSEPETFDASLFNTPPSQPVLPQPVKPSDGLKSFIKKSKPKQKEEFDDSLFKEFLDFRQWKRLNETGPYDARVAKKKNRTFNVWGSPPEGEVPQKSIDGEVKGVKNGRK